MRNANGVEVRATGLGLLVVLLLGPLAWTAGPQDEGAGQDAGEAKEEEAQAVEPPRAPAERKAIAGIASVTTRSVLEFPSLPDQPHVLDASYVFPDRARWRIAPKPAKVSKPGQRSTPEARRQARRLRFRWGTALWEVEPGEQASTRFTGEELRLALLQTEMRRVALIWPAELEWSGEGQERQATLTGLGTLHARLDPESGRPLEIESRDPDGTRRERFEKIAWRAEGGRHWPQSWELVADGNLVWRETFSLVTSGRKLVDAYFLPADQRDEQTILVVSKENVDQVKVPKFRAWRLRLYGEDQEWSKALEIGRTERDNWISAFEGTKYVIDDRPHYYVDEHCKPFMLEIRLKSSIDDYPAEWILQGGYPAVREIHARVDGLSGVHLRRLHSNLPRGQKGGAAYAAVQLTDTGSGITELVLPLKSSF